MIQHMQGEFYPMVPPYYLYPFYLGIYSILVIECSVLNNIRLIDLSDREWYEYHFVFSLSGKPIQFLRKLLKKSLIGVNHSSRVVEL
jgi:hypothetical protein